MRKAFRIILRILGALIAVLILIILAIALISGKHERTTRKVLEQELTNLLAPPGCIEINREYQSGGIDTVSTWFVKYNCQTTGGQAYETIITNLSKHGYQEQLDYSKKGPGIFYSFTYSSDKFTAAYNFKPEHNPTLGIEQKGILQSSPVAKISLDLTRK